VTSTFVSEDRGKRVALVTGSLSGIGLGIANSLAKRGFNIVLNGLTTQEELAKV
jgi:3-hydroxybutyrate dehydrogenase